MEHTTLHWRSRQRLNTAYSYKTTRLRYPSIQQALLEKRGWKHGLRTTTTYCIDDRIHRNSTCIRRLSTTTHKVISFLTNKRAAFSNTDASSHLYCRSPKGRSFFEKAAVQYMYTCMDSREREKTWDSSKKREWATRIAVLRVGDWLRLTLAWRWLLS
jgi:hypothetical protein